MVILSAGALAHEVDDPWRGELEVPRIVGEDPIEVMAIPCVDPLLSEALGKLAVDYGHRRMPPSGDDGLPFAASSSRTGLLTTSATRTAWSPWSGADPRGQLLNAGTSIRFPVLPQASRSGT